MVLEALEFARGQGGRGRDALGGEVGERGVIGLTVVHEDVALPADAEVLVRAQAGVWHGDEGDVGGVECLGGFAGGDACNVSICLSAIKG